MSQRYATRLNSFASGAAACWPDLQGRPGPADLVARAGTVRGLTDLDLNYPDQVEGIEDRMALALDDAGIALSGIALRYYSLPQYRAGAFTAPDRATRQSAIDLTRRGIDAARRMGTDLMTIWPGPEGYESSFQADYSRLWDDLLEGIAAVADHDPGVNISLEYKPDEPRGRAVLPDCATTLLFLGELNRRNTGVTLDFAHSLYAGEQPACAAALIARKSRLLGLHLNDGYGRRDDGLMVGAVHLRSTLELLMQTRAMGFDGPVYFDTFPDTADLDPVAECTANIRTCRRLIAACERLEADNRLPAALAAQDAVAGQEVVNDALLGPLEDMD